jgi:predicted secreted protein
MLHVDDSFANQTVHLAAGQVMELRLKENPTAGFRWNLIANGQPACAVVSDKFQPPRGSPGASGEHAWQIKALQAGNCRLQLFYQRPFSPKVPARTFALEVQVMK